MTREDSLMAMNGATLIGVADKLGVKCACNKTRTALKEAKANVIARILEAEATLAAQEQKAEEPASQEPEAPVTAEPVAVPEQKPQVLAKKEKTEKTEKKTEKPAKTEKAEKKAEKPAKTEKAEKKAEKPAKTEKTEKKQQEPAAEPAEITATVTALDEVFDKLNDLYFDSLLPKATITVRRAAKAYDCCSVKKGEDEGQYAIDVCADTIGKPMEETAASLLHAMVHLYCMEMGIAETCQKGRYHNNKFKKECEDRNLAVEYDSANGFVHTTPSEAFTESMKKAGVLDMQLAAIPAKKKGAERA